ncbi:MAG: tyrosine-type recombinase/integrase [Tenericutes bacterium]|nr:tyrosine-type recombinase/integrase [Mycoplasmatota bacterium]
MTTRLQQQINGGEKASRKCPNCHSKKYWKDGKRKTKNGSIQRFICRDCGYRFVEPPILSINRYNSSGRQICVTLTEGTKNLTEVETRTINGLAGATQHDKQLLFDFAWYMKKQGLKDITIKPRISLLRILLKNGADLFNPESVKEGIAKQTTWCDGRKDNAVNAYNTFVIMQGLQWNPPKYKRISKLPFIPTETELDQLIAGCGQRTATFLQILKETGARCGEAWQLNWTDIDFKNRILTITPEKGSNPRQFKISMTLIAMLNALPRNKQQIWIAELRSIRRNFQHCRKRIANSTQNPRIQKISFHTFRHWKATTEYHKTKDILHVMRVLGHKNITNTLRYTQLIQTDDDEFITKVAKTVEEACKLIEAGYEYVTEFQDQGVKIFRKRK